MLEVNNLSVTARSGAQLLNQISFQIEIGEAIGLTGQSGAGKTTLLKALLGILSGQRRHDPGGRPISMDPASAETAGAVRNDSGFYPAKPDDCI
mgnify:CR=1 FL=1